MPMNNPERAISTLTGEVHALFMSMQVILGTQSDPPDILRRLNQAEQAGLATIENAPIPDAVIEGYQHVFDAFRGILEARVAFRGNKET